MTLEQLYNLVTERDTTRSVPDYVNEILRLISDRETVNDLKHQEYIKAYEDLKRRNDEYPTQKRTKALQDMEERMRAQGLIQ